MGSTPSYEHYPHLTLVRGHAQAVTTGCRKLQSGRFPHSPERVQRGERGSQGVLLAAEEEHAGSDQLQEGQARAGKAPCVKHLHSFKLS